MGHRPTLDTLEAIRRLEDQGLDPKPAEVLVRLVDEAVQNGAASKENFLELELHVEKSERRVVYYLGGMVVIAGVIIAIIVNFEGTVRFLSGL